LQPYKIVHRDLKLDNLLVSEDWTIKITDFGLSIEMEDGATWDRFGGNIKYSAPEILKYVIPPITTPSSPTARFSFFLVRLVHR
jgi:serine/threonine protein kinase